MDIVDLVQSRANGSKSLSAIYKQLLSEGHKITLEQVKEAVNGHGIAVGWKDPNEQRDKREFLTDQEFIAEMARRWKWWRRHKPHYESLIKDWLCGNNFRQGCLCQSREGFFGFAFGFGSFSGFCEDDTVRVENHEGLLEPVPGTGLVRKFCEADWRKARNLTAFAILYANS